MSILFSRQIIKRKHYRAERMSKIRYEISRWLQEYEMANTQKHRDVCMQMVMRKLKQYEWYGHK